MNPCEGTAWNRVVSNSQGRLCCCQRVRLGEKHVQLQPANPSPSPPFPHHAHSLIKPGTAGTKTRQTFLPRHVFGSLGTCIQNPVGKTSGMCFTGSLSCGGNISGLDPAVQLVNKQECEFPRTFIADGPLLLAPVVP